MKLKPPPKPATNGNKTAQKQQPPVNYFVVCGTVMVVQSSMMQASGPMTSSLKLFGSLGGAICCLAGAKQELDKQKQKK